ncbi:MBL fold metallo-hydrolase [Bacteroidia bacterium]|nr:MBL fold metallo-hydrolase [Bacteroidia bacterium]GHT28229.1 MBL fold metallo-hydrolase [Bacteroidia bacterium]GHV70837.1 MBL fold metallo-hydrolase [Bacteroidia bacterium]
MIQYRILETGFFLADGGAMFGAIPKRAWSRKYPSGEGNCCRLAMNCLLVWNENRVVLLDTGVGDKDLGKLSYYRFQDLKDLTGLIRMQGFEPHQVTDVVLSHLHFDHCGGCTYKNGAGNLQVTFPNARHWVGKSQWENYLNPNGLEIDSFRPQDVMPVMDAGLLHLVEENFELFEGFHLKLFDGHTPGQIVSFIETGKDEILLFSGDVIPTKAHGSPEWISAYDIEPLKSLAAKIKLKELTSGKKANTVFYHDACFLPE